MTAMTHCPDRPGFLPRLSSHHLSRERLIEPMLASTARVKLLCAPAGSGKSALLSECLLRAPEHYRVCWLPLAGASLSAADFLRAREAASNFVNHLDLTVDRVEPERLFSWRWHPNAIDPAVDYSAEPTTLVVFELEEVDGGTLLTVVESGFDRLPAPRREQAFSGNEGGWAMQMEFIANHVSKAS